jgi:hypothetical protein
LGCTGNPDFANPEKIKAGLNACGEEIDDLNEKIKNFFKKLESQEIRGNREIR